MLVELRSQCLSRIVSQEVSADRAPDAEPARAPLGAAAVPAPDEHYGPAPGQRAAPLAPAGGGAAEGGGNSRNPRHFDSIVDGRVYQALHIESKVS